MKTHDKYRFSLQFGMVTDEQVLVGDLLERLGNKKSGFIVKVISEYIHAHPGLSEPTTEIRVETKPGITRQQLEKMIRSILDERMAGAVQSNITIADTPEVANEDVNAMLDNLDIFTR